MKAVIIAAALAAPASASAAGGYSDTPAVVAYKTKPCTEIIGAIDTASSKGVYNVALGGMYWGFLLGYDEARGGLRGSEETTLIRLRKACAASPNTPALVLLKSF